MELRPWRAAAGEPSGGPGGRWTLSDEALDALLGSLDPDRERAAHKYEDLRHKLVVFFCARGVAGAEDQADVALDRLSRRIAEGEPIRDLGRFAYGVARLVLRESQRNDRRRRDLLERSAPVAPPATTIFDSDAAIECLRRCIGRLEPDQRGLILTYYESDGLEGQRERQQLALRLGISRTALRLRVHRIRSGLEACTRRCLGYQGRCVAARNGGRNEP